MATATQVEGKVQHLDHFVLPVMEPERAEKFYTEILGARVLSRVIDPGLTRIFAKVGENHVGLFSQSKAAIPKRETVDSYPRCAFLLPEAGFEAAAGKVRRMSGLVKETGDEKGCGLGRGLIFTDSEGNLLEIFRGEKERAARVHHLHFDTLGLEESIEFYTSILRLELLKRTGNIAALGIPAGQTLVLHQVNELSEVTKTAYRGRHFAFYVSDDDFHAIVEKLHRAGIEERDEHGEREGRRPGQLGTYFKDPSGFRVQIANEDSSAFARQHAA